MGKIDQVITKLLIGGFALFGVVRLVRFIKCKNIPSALQRLNEKSVEKEKMLSGQFYSASNPLLEKQRLQARYLVCRFNKLNLPDQDSQRLQVLKQLLFYEEQSPPIIIPPFQCDYGYNIRIGKGCYFNFNTVMLDNGGITIGDNCLVGPNVCFYTATHGTDAKSRLDEIQYAKPIQIGQNVYIEGNVIILPGVSIGDNSVIRTGAVVTKSIEANSIVEGNPGKAEKKLLGFSF